MTTLREPNEIAAIGLAAEMYPHLADYAKAHGAPSTVIDGLWAMAHLVAYLCCSRGVDPQKARDGFVRALDYAIETAPPEETLQ
jgi:hypothetical protein